MALSVVIPILALVVGLMFEPYILAAMMLLIEILFSLLLFVEIKRM
jgi:hypothetical protein